MEGINNELLTLLGSQAFSNLINSRNMKIIEFDAIISLLIKAQIPFDVEYIPGTKRFAESAELSIFLNPGVNLTFKISFQSGSALLQQNTL